MKKLIELYECILRGGQRDEADIDDQLDEV